MKSKRFNTGIGDPTVKTGMSTGRLVAFVVGIVLLLGVLCVLILIPVVRQKNRALAREQARSNCRELVSAVQRQHKDFNRLPTNTVDADGNALLSWRYELLFYSGHQMVGDRFDRSLPWNSKGHHKILDPIAEKVPGSN